MKKQILSVLLVSLSILLVPSHSIAQTDIESLLEKVIAEKSAIQEQLNEMNAKKSNLEKQLADQENQTIEKEREFTKIQQRLDEANGKILALKSEKKNLEDEVKQVRKNLAEKEEKSLKKENERLKEQIGIIKGERDSLRRDNDKLFTVKVAIIKQRQEIFEELAQKNFSVINPTELTQALQDCMPFHEEMKGVIEILTHAQEGKMLYDRAFALTQQMYSKAEIVNVTIELEKRISMNFDSPRQQDELRQLKDLFPVYEQGVQTAQAIISMIRKDKLFLLYQDTNDKENANELLKKDYFEYESYKSEIEKTICQVPFLKEHFARFQHQILENPFKVSKEEADLQDVKL